MPHVIVKLYPGRSEQEKARLAERIVKDVISILNSAEESVSVAIQEVKPADWAERVYRPDILGHRRISTRSRATTHSGSRSTDGGERAEGSPPFCGEHR